LHFALVTTPISRFFICLPSTDQSRARPGHYS
jgi:hypothetical protein